MKFNRKNKGKVKVSKAVKKFVHTQLVKEIEDKYTNQIYNSFCSSDDGNVLYYSGLTDTISQAVGDVNARVGDEITLVSLEARGYTFLDTSASGANDRVVFRAIFFQYHEVVATSGNQGTALNAILPLSRILLNGVTGNRDSTSLYNHDRRNEYTILYDKTWVQCNSNNTNSAPPFTILKSFHFRVPLRKARKRLKYVAGSPSTASEQIFVAILTQNASSASLDPSAQFAYRVNYRDA